MIEEIKQLRISIDGLAQLTKELKPIKFEQSDNKQIGFNSKEIEKAYDSLILAKAWLGKVLAELGTENPYKSGYKTVEDIEPTADTNDNLDMMVITSKQDWGNLSHIEKVDWLRQKIASITCIDLSSSDIHKEAGIDATIYFQHFMKEISEAKFWLGFELQRIKENK
jgi:hypothetical protein